jgi:endonuclease/exonuclease/phosphatase family metal-dependent hydrolase
VTTDPDLDALMPRDDVTFREAGIVPFALDWIIGVAGTEVADARVLSDELALGASDHFPVTATIRY